MLVFCDNTNMRLVVLSFLLVSVWCNGANGGALTLTKENFDMTIASNELVFINFYADWCHFSNLLSPVFDEAADKIKEKFSQLGQVVVGKVDCDKQDTIASRFQITKYPTLKLVRNGQPVKREYRGQRSAQAFLDFITKQLEDPIKEFYDVKDLSDLDDKKRMLIGYFPRKDIPQYEIYRRVATNLKDDCHFHVGFGEASQAMHPPSEPIIVFRSDKALSNDDDEIFKGNLNSFDELHIWAQQKCVPLVREITFENAEELTEEGLPFLILFHAPDDHESIKEYKDTIANTMTTEKQNVNFLTADGIKFAHPLHHLGKSKDDLPLIAIDSFKHMYLFSNFKDMRIPGKLKTFLDDLYSGKLHREFHYGPDPELDPMQLLADQGKVPTTPPESTFKKLAPSKNRYTLLRDEL
ncbi:endoplasmic reticulum resident protein 44 [Leptopilina heterotoma]|uniref:endoplasmic reticulum resident protein 44 n=1 Tax=Leptopilina heterotoma TaxID=63436 RepID=UPI001CA9EC09|nr:endoplasmic reticulum resident protein 44 [Leptopilina heterotoma]